VGYFLVGQLKESELFKLAENSDKKRDNNQHCEAYFYAGTKRLIAGDKTTALEYFEKCIATDAKGYTEYQSAAAELHLLKATE